jgi:hypothetical protein
MLSVSAVRWRGRAPRVALLASCALLSAAGLRSLVTRAAPPSVAVAKSSPTIDVAEFGLAEAFARTYLSGQRSSTGSFGRPDDGLPVDDVRRARVEATWIAGWERRGGGAVVTVAVEAPGRRWYLAVTVARDPAGRLWVAGAPAVVGPPLTASGTDERPEIEVDDAALKTVVGRVMRHYLARDAGDLAADLAAHTALTLPPSHLFVEELFAVTWIETGSRVAATVVARDRDGDRMTLRYELPVLRSGGRWLVRGVHVNPTYMEVGTP